MSKPINNSKADELDCVGKDLIEEMWYDYMSGFIVNSIMREKFYHVLEQYMKGAGGVPIVLSEEDFKQMSVMVQELHKFADRAPTQIIKGICNVLLTGMVAIRIVENRGLVGYHNKMIDNLTEQMAGLNKTTIDEIKDKYFNMEGEGTDS